MQKEMEEKMSRGKAGKKAAKRAKPYYRDGKYWSSKNEYKKEKRKKNELIKKIGSS